MAHDRTDHTNEVTRIFEPILVKFDFIVERTKAARLDQNEIEIRRKLVDHFLSLLENLLFGQTFFDIDDGIVIAYIIVPFVIVSIEIHNVFLLFGIIFHWTCNWRKRFFRCEKTSENIIANYKVRFQNYENLGQMS